MKLQEIKKLFKAADKDWSANLFQRLWYGRGRDTSSGFCNYFTQVHMLHPIVIEEQLSPYWEKYRTKIGLWAFKDKEERAEVLKKIIKDIEEESPKDLESAKLILKKTLAEDESYKASWVSNITISFKYEMEREAHKSSNPRKPILYSNPRWVT